MDRKKVEKFKHFFSHSLIIKNGTIDFLPSGDAIITAGTDESAGKRCPYCGKTKIGVARVDAEDAEVQGGTHVWKVRPCSCFSCLRLWMVLENEIGQNIVICERPQAKMAGLY